MKIVIELVDGWWDYDVYHESRHLCGTSRNIHDIMNLIPDQVHQIQRELKNPKRNP